MLELPGGVAERDGFRADIKFVLMGFEHLILQSVLGECHFGIDL